MPIVTADLKFYLSGGSSNAVPDSSLGGAKSSVEMVDNVIHNLFDLVNTDESAAGDTEYRCIYVENTHASITLTGATVNLVLQTTSTTTTIELGLGTSAIGGTEQTIADEDTAPVGVTYTALIGSANALSIGDLLPGESKAIWFKWIVDPASPAFDGDTMFFEFGGGTSA